MKKVLINFLTGIFCAAAVFADDVELNYVVMQDTYKYSGFNDSVKETLKKDSVITADSSYDVLSYSDIQDLDTTLLISKNNESIPVTYLKPQNSNDLLPENLITHDDSKRIRNLIPEYYLDILKSGNLKKLKDYETNYSAGYEKSEIGKLSADGVANYLSNCGIHFFSYNYIAFKNITKKSESLYECEGISRGDYDPFTTDMDCFRWSSLLRNTPKNQTDKFLFETDGDYLNISYALDNKPIISLVYVSDSTMDELEHLFRTNTCDLTKITWPRHADGKTYNDKNAGSQSKIKKYMFMHVKENLKLRSGENTTSKVIAVMTPGACVKILEIGKAETIDGISSAWVKVEVSYGQDKDGNEINARTVGWCYGGYLE